MDKEQTRQKGNGKIEIVLGDSCNIIKWGFTIQENHENSGIKWER